tara:strand:+ start:3316 stop:4209 length:894 start_codon:yes stop_codon:yes gene_type:complete
MNKETKKKLLAPFPEEVVQDPPKGKFGKFVNHAVYVERLRDCDVKYEWEFEPVIIDNKIVGAIGKLTIDGLVYQGAGDVEANALQRATQGECLKLAESDAFKRASMRAGLGVELWSGTDDFYMEDDKPKATKPKATKKQDKVIDKSAKEFEDMVKDNPNKKQQLDHTVSAMIPDEKAKKKLMNETYNKVTSEQGFPENIEKWTVDQMSTYITMIEVVIDESNDEQQLVEEVFGETKDLTQNCPECGKSEWIEDNRQKKQDDPDKFGKIPSWSCNNYGDKEGCGWVGWGDTDCPTEWL